MTLQEAGALTRFINRSSERYRAQTLPMGESSARVVLQQHCHTEGSGGNTSGSNTLPPITDVHSFLAAMTGDERMTEECRELLEAWIEEQDEDDNAATAAAPDQLRQELQPHWNLLSGDTVA